jgi:hypothetical protein
MILKYQVQLDKYDIKDLTDPILDGKFVSKATAFEAARAKGTLSPEEIEATDTELCELFDKLHEFEEVDDSTVTQLKKQVLFNEVKSEANATEDLQELTAMVNKYKDYPELVTFIGTRAKGIQAELEKQAKDEAEAKAKEENETAEAQAKAKAEAERLAAEAAKNNSLKTKLLAKEHWKYSELRELGIEPTDHDMVVDGVYLKQVYLFNVYQVKGTVKEETT